MHIWQIKNEGIRVYLSLLSFLSYSQKIYIEIIEIKPVKTSDLCSKVTCLQDELNKLRTVDHQVGRYLTT